MKNERLLKQLADARDEARFALDLVSRHGAAVTSDPTGRRALERACEIAGEALRQLVEYDPEIATEYPDLPWREAIGLRTKLAHGYDSLNPGQLVGTVENHFPDLIGQIEKILDDNP